MIAVGLVPQLYKLDHQPGWLPHSVAFHADDGKYVSCIVLFLFTKHVLQCTQIQHNVYICHVAHSVLLRLLEIEKLFTVFGSQKLQPIKESV